MIEPKKTKHVQVAESILSLMMTGALRDITHSRVARATKISRAWLYKYVGKSREDLLTLATDHFGKMFSELEDDFVSTDAEDWIKGQMEGLTNMFRDAEIYPGVLAIYFRYRGTSNLIGKRIAYIENIYLSKCSKELIDAFPKMSMAQANLLIEFLMTARMGLVLRWTTDSGDRAEKKKMLLEFFQGVLRNVIESFV